MGRNLMKTEIAVFGGGCFWCTEAVFQRLKGVRSVISGYAGGTAKNPTYEEVCADTTNHAEVVKIEFDPEIISYQELLTVFWSVHNPTTLNRQGNDTGRQYRSIILYTSQKQKELAESSIQKIEKSNVFDQPVVTEVKHLADFYPAEPHHQKYYDRYSFEPYCQLVIAPKLEKLKEKFASILK